MAQPEGWLSWFPRLLRLATSRDIDLQESSLLFRLPSGKRRVIPFLVTC